MRFVTERWPAYRHRQVFWFGLTLLLLVTQVASARINVVTLPGRDMVQLTIYNSADLTLAKETRVLNFRKGLNRLEFSWANTLIDPWQIETQNSKEIDVVLDVRRNFSGDWSLKTDARYEKVDANRVKFLLPLKPREKQQFTYEVTTNYGSNASR